jgi:CDP-diacylglycerol---serine O-phosphatidyltransferase
MPTLPVLPRPNMRRAVVLLPNGFTLGNLFFGVWAIVAASRGSYSQAGLYVVLGGVMDALDGRVARATKTGSRFGTELDSLVDAVSFGVAPALIMYFAVLNREGWAWLLCFIFIACVVMRLARFNVEQGGRAKTHFHGLPSPAAGMTLAVYYWFSQTPLYSQTVIGDLPWELVMKVVMLVLSWLMVSHVLYPAVPNISFRSWKGFIGLGLVLGTLAGLLFAPREFFFPALMAYVVWGLLKTVFVGLMDRLPTGDPLFEEGDDDDTDRMMRPVIVGESPGGRKRRRRSRGDRQTPPINRSITESE